MLPTLSAEDKRILAHGTDAEVRDLGIKRDGPTRMQSIMLRENARRGGGMSAEHRAFVAYLHGAPPSPLLTARADMNEGTGSAGGYIAPLTFAEDVIVSLKYASAFTAYSKVWQSASGAPAKYPIVGAAELSNVASTIGENTQLTEGDLSGLSQISFGQTPLWSGTNLARVSLPLLQDVAWTGVYPTSGLGTFPPTPVIESGIDIEKLLVSQFTARLARGVDAAWAAKAIAGPATTVTTASNSAITYAELVKAFYSLDASYRGNPRGAAWVMNSSTAQYIRGILDSSNRPILTEWRSAPLPDGQWDGTSGLVTSTLFGLPVVESSNMAAIGATNVVAVLADWSNYFVVRIAGAPSVQRLSERYADTGEVAFVVWARLDAAVGLPGAALALTMHS
jgi:hypothetical protein